MLIEQPPTNNTFQVEKPLSAFTFPSKPTIAPKFEKSMQLVDVQTNHFNLKLNLKRATCHQYTVEIAPEIPEDSRQLRYMIIDEVAQQITALIGEYYLSGLTIFAPKKVLSNLKTANMVFDTKRKVNGQKFSVRLTFANSINLEDVYSTTGGTNKDPAVQFMNIFVKSILHDMKFVEIGRNSQFFLRTKEFQHGVHGTDLDVWSGFKTSVDIYEGNQVKLLVDFSSRILRKDNMLEHILHLRKKNRGKKDQITKDIKGRSVMASYGNYRIYRIQDIDWTKTPMSKIPDLGISYIEYYAKCYAINIHEERQPLLLAHTKGALNGENDKPIFLIPELCRMTGLEKRQRNDERLMEKIAQFTRLSPDVRYKHIKSLVNKVQKRAKNQWGIEFENSTPSVKAHIMTPPRIRIGDKKEVKIRDGNFNVRDMIYDQGAVLRDWAIIYSKGGRQSYKDDKMADKLAFKLKECGKQLGIKVKRPTFISLNLRNRRTSISKEISYYVKNNRRLPKCILILIDNQYEKLYKEIKDATCKQLGIVSQVVLKDTLKKGGRGKGGMNMSIISNILQQIMAKIGSKLWIVQRPRGLPKHTMLIGADVFHNTGKNKQSVVGFCASMDRFFSKYASISHVQEGKGAQEIVHCIGDLMERALCEYEEVNERLPELIVFYRDGVGESQMQFIMDIEIPAIKKTFRKFGDDYNPQFAEITVNKRIDDRFFINNGTANPRPGTIISSEVVSDNFEFFMVAQNVTCGTVTGTKFFVCENNTKLTQDQFWQLTHNQCYNYFNWSGAIRVPAPCFYAHKLGYLIGQTFASESHIDLLDKLYYL